MKTNRAITAVLVVIGIAIGFLVGRTTGSSGDSGGEDSGSGQRAGEVGSKSDRSGGDFGTRTGDRAGSSGRSAAASIRQVARQFEISPMASMDFDAMFEAYNAIRWMSPRDIQLALAELEGMSTNPQIKMAMTMMLINQWAKQDGQGAVEFAMLSEQPMIKTMGIMGGIQGWVKQDPEGAYTWYKENQEKLSKGGMLAGQLDGMILAALAQRDLPRAFEGLLGLKKPQQQMALGVMGSQVTMDPARREQFVQQLEKLDDAELRQRGLEGMVQMWAFQDPHGAAEYIESREWQGETGQQLRARLAESWAGVNAEEALAWRLENLGENEDRAGVVAQGFAQWMTQDPEGAQKWLKTQPVEVMSDQLYQQTATQLQWRNDYTEAVNWAGKIEEQTTREATMRGIYATWSQQDEDAARQWVEGLDPALREAVQLQGPVPETTDVLPVPATDAIETPAPPNP